MMDTSAITGTNVSNHEGTFCQATAVDINKFAVRELPKAEEYVHEELIIHSLEAQVWGGSVCREQSA